jgi:hypothetical protein
MPMISYRCPDCGSDAEHFHHSASSAPVSIQCSGFKEKEAVREKIERQVVQPDGSIVLEYEEVELAPALEVCAGTMLQRDSHLDPSWARPARGFEALVIFERANYDQQSDDFKRGHDRYYIPGRNYELTEPGMKRIEITNIAQYNQVSKSINAYETNKMRDHRAMHEEYFKARRKAMREDVNARVGPMRNHPLISYLRTAMRKRSDQKSAVRYGKALDAHFHAQLIEYDQGKIQDWCAEDTGWKARRAK